MTEYRSSETMQPASRAPSFIDYKKPHQSGILYQTKAYKNKGKVKTIAEMTKLKEFTKSPTLQEPKGSSVQK